MPPAIRALSFDLFDTLVDLTLEALPPVRIDGELGLADGAGAPRALGEGSAVSFEVFARTLRGVDRDIRREPVRGRPRGLDARALRARSRARSASTTPPLVERWRAEHMSRLRAQVREVDAPRGAPRARSTRARARRLLELHRQRDGARRPRRGRARAPPSTPWRSPTTVGWRKPRREIFEAVARALDVDPREILHVGDNLDADVAGAAAAGMRTAWLTRRVADPSAAFLRYRGPRPEFTSWRISAELPAARSPDLSALPALLK